MSSLWANKIGILSTRSVVTVSCSVMPTAYRIFKILSPFDRTESSYFQNERFRWDDFAVDFTRKNMEEQNARHEELKRQCMEAILDANRMDSNIKTAQSLFSGAVKSQRFAVELYAEQLIHAQRQMQALEERLRRELTPDTTE